VRQGDERRSKIETNEIGGAQAHVGQTARYGFIANKYGTITGAFASPGTMVPPLL